MLPYHAAAIAGAILPMLVVVIAKADRRLDIANPRDVHATQTGLRKRAYGAHLNGMEALPLFLTALFVATERGVDLRLPKIAALAWIAARVIYTVLYLANFSMIRPAMWAAGQGVAVTIAFLPAARG